MKWIPMPLDGGSTLAHMVIPADIRQDEAEKLIAVIRRMLPEPPPPTPTLVEQVPAARPKTTPAPSDLELETRAVVDTARAAYYLNRRPQILRGWACHEDGPLRPIRINGRLAWPVAELRKCMCLDTGAARRRIK